MSPEPQNNDLLTLREVLMRLWRRRASLVAVPLIVGALAVAITFFLPPTYAPQAVVSIEMPLRVAGSEPAVPLETVVQTSRHLLGSATLRQDVMEEMASEGLIFEQKAFNSSIGVNVPRESQLINILFRDEDPALAARVANALADNVTTRVNAFNSSQMDTHLERYRMDIDNARDVAEAKALLLNEFRTESQLELLQEQINVAALRRIGLEDQILETELAMALLEVDPIGALLTDAETHELSLREELHLPLLQNRRTALLDQQRREEADLLQTRVDLAAKSETLAALEEGLAGQEPTVNLNRAIVDDPLMQQALAEARSSDLGGVLAAGIRSESLNPIHAQIATEVISTRGEVAALTERQSELTTSLAGIAEELTNLESQINTGQMNLDSAERTVALIDSEFRARHSQSAESLTAQRDLLNQEITALTASLEKMRTAYHTDSAALTLLEQDWELAVAQVRVFTEEMSTASLNILEAMPTLAVRLPAVEPMEPESKNRKMVLLAGLLLGLALSLFRAYLLEF